MNKLNVFLFFLVISLAGNAAADFAMIWYGIEALNGKFGDSQAVLQLFYVGQAIGILVLGPFIAAHFDNLPKRYGAFFLDMAYAALLLLALILVRNGNFGGLVVFLLASITAAVALVHKGSVAFYAVQALSPEGSGSAGMSKLIIALNSSFLFGSALSGFIYKKFGVEGCFLLGMVSFVPVSISYFYFFDNKPVEKKFSESLFSKLSKGYRVVLTTLELRTFMFFLSALNLIAAIMPAWVGISLYKILPGRADIFSIFISMGVGVGILITPWTSKLARENRLNWTFSLALLPFFLSVVLHFVFQNVYTVALVFIVNCIATSYLSVVAGILRIKLISKTEIGRVNTVYSSGLYIGQLIGSLILLPLVEKNTTGVSVLMLLIIFSIGLFSFFQVPNNFVKEYMQ